MAGLTEFYCGWNEPSHASQFKWLEYTFKGTVSQDFYINEYICNSRLTSRANNTGSKLFSGVNDTGSYIS
jgi:hypothetical protein